MLAGTHGFLDPHYSQTGQFDSAADGYAVGLSAPSWPLGLPTCVAASLLLSVSPRTRTRTRARAHTHTHTHTRGDDADGANGESGI